jgi:drug/metabolite transporter (DMT)-like permease
MSSQRCLLRRVSEPASRRALVVSVPCRAVCYDGSVTFQKYLVLLAVAVFAAVGDVLLARGMRDIGQVSLANWHHAILAIANPWVIVGTIFLIAFFGMYLAALSWADLTYVLPATSISYVVMAVLGRLLLHEQISGYRWAGITLITLGVGFVATADAKTERQVGDGAPMSPSVPAVTEHHYQKPGDGR